MKWLFSGKSPYTFKSPCCTASCLVKEHTSTNRPTSLSSIFSSCHFSRVCPGGHWLKSRSLKLKDNLDCSSFTLRSSLTLAVRLSEVAVLLNLFSNLLFFFAAILHNEFINVAEIRNSTIASQQIILGERRIVTDAISLIDFVFH